MNLRPKKLSRPILDLPLLMILALFAQAAGAQQSGLVAAGAVVQEIQTGFGFLEGPVSDNDGNLFFTDINNNRVHRLDSGGDISVAYSPSNHANGLALDWDGSLLICEQSGQRLTRMDSRGNISVIADGYNGQPFNSPNDLWVHRNGAIYFTDPRYRYPEGDPSQPGEYVYLISSDRQTVTAVVTDVPKPNGIIGAEDGSHLYVASTELRKVFRYDIARDLTLGNRIEFADQGSDGMTMDERGNIYLTWAGKVSIYNPAGDLIEEIEAPQNPANVGFGGDDGHTLYMTARTGLYSIRMNVTASRGFPRP